MKLLLFSCFMSFASAFLRSNQSADGKFSRGVETFSSTSFAPAGSYSFTVPAGVSTITMTLYGAIGGSSFCSGWSGTAYGGYGGVISADIPVTSGELLFIYVGSQGTNSAGGYNGGGAPCYNINHPGGGGGGATDVRRQGNQLSDRLLVAGGGGGSYCELTSHGANAGYPSGESASGLGGTSSAGGARSGSGTDGTFGAGGYCTGGYGSGGGGGYYGGGGAYGAGSGGGSSWAFTGYISSGITNSGDGSAYFSWVAVPPTVSPTRAPSCNPTNAPTVVPTRAPTYSPSQSPTCAPTATPTMFPTQAPTQAPSMAPSTSPTLVPTTGPTISPTLVPTVHPTAYPTTAPTTSPTAIPTTKPSTSPTITPTVAPTVTPTTKPTVNPTAVPTVVPTAKPTAVPSALPTSQPSCSPSSQPSASPTNQPSAQPTCRPSRQPTSQPTHQPTSRPTAQPSAQPSRQPSRQPTSSPSVQPTAQPSRRPSAQPSRVPTAQPTTQPTRRPTAQPSRQPSSAPSMQPSSQPSAQPSRQPTEQPSAQPTSVPSAQPSVQPSSGPTVQPSAQPSNAPSVQPSAIPSTQPSSQPSMQPTAQPTEIPTTQPSTQPSILPSAQPSAQPSSAPSEQPSSQPSSQPSAQPSSQPTVVPSGQPSSCPTAQPTTVPSVQPSTQPSVQPSATPTAQPSDRPSSQPSGSPSAQPSATPSHQPSTQPSSMPSMQPLATPSAQPTSPPTSQPSSVPSAQPSSVPSPQPSSGPTSQPSGQPSSAPSMQPSVVPSAQPTSLPSSQPSSVPSAQPSSVPSAQPSSGPTTQPSRQPSSQPSAQPSATPSAQPTSPPTSQPSSVPSAQPSSVPSAQPSSGPTSQPSGQPSSVPSMQPSVAPSAQPTSLPSSQPSSVPSAQPSNVPSTKPSCQPTSIPSARPSASPSTQPSASPSAQPSVVPSAQPSGAPTNQPSAQPTCEPSSQPSAQPSSLPSAQPSERPSAQPSSQPTGDPTSQPSSLPSSLPTTQPSAIPTTQPSVQPSVVPSMQPSGAPTSQPSVQPSVVPSSQPSGAPTDQPSGQPSIVPSSQPSSNPSSVPSAQPTTSPTSQPSSTPSTQPSAAPTAAPTSVPSAGPTSVPTSAPSAAPTSAPTSSPSGQPSGYPTSQPSSGPSFQPVSHPTSQPSAQPSSSPSQSPTAYQSSRFIYSKAPTAVPTCSPTLSELAVWTNKMQSTLVEVTANDTSAVVHRSTYYELDVVSTSPSTVYGGCAAWRAAVSADMKPSQFVYKAASLSVSAVIDPNSGDRLETFAAASAQCQDPIVTNSILGALVGSPQMAGGVSVSRSFQCGLNAWVVKHCLVGGSGPPTTSTYAPAMCVDCADPCSSVAQCNANPSSEEDRAMTVSPCVPQLCTGESSSGAQYTAATGLRVLSISYTDIEKAPEVLSVVTSVSRTSIRVTAQMSSAGSLYCAVYRTAASVNSPTSISAVLLQNIAATADSTNTSVVDIPGLDAATSYRVYLMAASPIGVKSSLDKVVSSVREVTTACCKTLTATLSTSSAIELQSAPNVLAVVLSSRPSAALRIDVQLFSVSPTSGEATLHAQSLFPRSFTISSISTLSTLRASLPALPVGVYVYRLVLSGAAVDEYEVVYTSGAQRIEVLSSIAEPPVPQLTQAVFAKDGSYLAVLFSANTNRGGTATSFTCSALFDFDCATTSRCQWTDSATVRAYIQGTTSADSCAKAGSDLRLSSSAQIKARCQATNDNGNGNACPKYADWKTVTATTLTIAAPASPVAPAVAISAPNVLGSCDSLTLDVSGSTGSGGRGWTDSSITVLSAQGNSISALSAHLRNLATLTPPPSIPAALLNKGFQYNFQVKLCNFLGQCNTARKQVLVLNDTLPSVSLPGPAVRTVSRKDSWVLTSAAFVSSCDGKRSSAGLTFKWSLFSNGIQLLNTQSTSRDASRYLLPPFSLAAGGLYQVVLSVSAAGNTQSSTASVQVYVQPGSIVATIKGGSFRSMRVGDTLSLDGSPSYDEDASAAVGLVHSWSCIQTSPTFQSSCLSLFDNTTLKSSASAAVFRLVALSGAAGTEGQVTLEVTDNSRQRSAKRTVTVSVLAALAPVVSVTAPSVASTGVINAGQLLQLTGTLSVPASMGGNATWVVDDQSIQLKSIALFPLTVSVAPVSSSYQSALSSRAVFMAFPGNSLPSGTTLTFSLVGVIPFQGNQAVGSVTVTVNAPPTPGSFYVTPDEGVELDKVFQFVALNWVDPDLPVTYQFSYLDPAGLVVVIRSKQELSFGSSMLPAGSSEASRAVTCVAQIFDVLNANSSASYTVKVTLNENFNASQVQDFVTRSLLDASDADSIKQATALSSYLLNSVNCSLAPNCSALHRQSCQSTAHTCGICESLDFVGEQGDSNEACVRVLPSSNGGERRLSSAFTRYSSAQVVTAANQIGIKKACPADCSGHGQCVHVVRDSGKLITADMPPCLEGMIGCQAVCDCDADYFGSDACEVSTEEFTQKQSSRAEVIAALRTLVSAEDPDEQVISGWVNGLSQATQGSAELTEQAVLSVLSLVDTVTTSARTVATASSTVSSTVIAGLLNAVNAVADSSAKAAVRRRLLEHRLSASTSSRQVSAVTPSVTRDLLNSFGTLVASSMLPGQDAMQFTQGEFRMSVLVMFEGSSGVAEVAVPLTPLEKHLGAKSSQVSLPASSATDGISVVATTLRSEQFSSIGGADMLSNPLILHSSAQVCSAPPCFVDVVLQNSQPVGFDTLNAGEEVVEVHSATCLLDDQSVHDFTCQNGEVLHVHCAGVAGEVSQRCPVISYSGACNSLSSSADSVLSSGEGSGCTVVSYTADEVTCRCEYFAQQVTASNADEITSRRALQSQGYNISAPAGYSVSYVSMLQASTQSFVSTIQTADDLNASSVTSGWRALATLGSLAASIVVGLLWSHHSDNQAKRVTPTEENNTSSRLTLNKTGKSAGGKNASGARKVRFNTRAKKALVNAELAIVEDSLPRVLSSRTFSDRFLEEVKQHHRWFGIIFYFSDSFPRVLRVISLATNAIVMLFIQSITYNLTNPDDDSCQQLHSEVDCLGPRSPFATGESKCAWVPVDDSGSSIDGSCEFIEPDKSMRIILFVAIFCAIVTTPIALAADWVVLNVLAAPTELQAAENAQNLKSTVEALPSPTSPDALMTSLVPNPSTPSRLRRTSSARTITSFLGIFNEEKMKEDNAMLAVSRAELLMLSMKLKSYRAKLRPDEVEEFNVLWGLDSDGKFLTKAAEATTLWGRVKALFVKKEDVNVKEAVLMDLKNVNAAVRRESARLSESGAAKYEIGKRLLFLFQCDLLPGISGKILELKGSRDTSHVKHVSLTAKMFGYLFLFLLDAGMLFYILLFALTQTGPRQNAWFQSFALWLVVEILLVSTAIVFFTHILIPSLIMKDITQIKRRLMDNIRDFNDKVQSDKDKGVTSFTAEDRADDSVSFNAANFLFVSTRLARQFPDLKESKIIAQFSTPWPRQSYLHVQNVSKKYSKKFSAFTRSASILLIFFVGNFLSVPPSVQDIVVQMTSTTAIGYIVLIHVQLFEIFPALVILPSLVLAVLAHFIVQSSKADAKIKLARLFPASIKKNNKVALDEASKIDGVADEVSEVAAVRADELCAEDEKEEEKSEYSSDECDNLGALPVVTVGQPQLQQHRTRRQSIQTGLDLMHAMKQGFEQRMSGSDNSNSSISSADESSQDASSSDSSSLSERDLEGAGHDPYSVDSGEGSDEEAESTGGEEFTQSACSEEESAVHSITLSDQWTGSPQCQCESLHLAADSPLIAPHIRKSLTSSSTATYDDSDSDSADGSDGDESCSDDDDSSERGDDELGSALQRDATHSASLNYVQSTTSLAERVCDFESVSSVEHSPTKQQLTSLATIAHGTPLLPALSAAYQSDNSDGSSESGSGVSVEGQMGPPVLDPAAAAPVDAAAGSIGLDSDTASESSCDSQTHEGGRDEDGEFVSEEGDANTKVDGNCSSGDEDVSGECGDEEGGDDDYGDTESSSSLPSAVDIREVQDTTFLDPSPPALNLHAATATAASSAVDVADTPESDDNSTSFHSSDEWEEECLSDETVDVQQQAGLATATEDTIGTPAAASAKLTPTPVVVPTKRTTTN